MYELEKEWQTASNGFLAGIDFKTWLADQVVALRAAAQNRVQAYWLCKDCGAHQHKDFDTCGDCNAPRR